MQFQEKEKKKIFVVLFYRGIKNPKAPGVTLLLIPYSKLL